MNRKALPTKLSVLFGSQTGQSEAIATEIVEKCRSLIPDTQIYSFEEFVTENKKILKLQNLPNPVVFVISSTGDGDPPDNALKFVRLLCKKDNPPDLLKHVTFALLGLGDSNYSTFLGCPKKVEKKLLDLGAQKFHDTGFCDDAVGLEIVAEPWMTSLVAKLESLRNMQSDSDSTTTDHSNLPASCEIEKLTLNVDEKNSNKTKLKEEADETVGGDLYSCGLPPSSKPTRRPGNMEDEDEEEEENIDYSLPACQCQWKRDVPCLVQSNALSTELELRVPVSSEPYLSLCFSHLTVDEDSLVWQNGAEFPGTLGGVKKVPFLYHKQITKVGAPVPKFEFALDIQGTEIAYQPGDAFYIVFPNPDVEVEYILRRLRLAMLADNQCQIDMKSDTKHPKPTMPAHIPTSSTLRHILTWCVDIRRTPGRPLLRILADHAIDETEKRRILELTSSQGVKEFTDYVRKAGLSLCDVLHAFPSVLVPAERLLEHLPRLQPRPYSVACSPLEFGNTIRFAYSRVSIPSSDGRFYSRSGLCTGWLEDRKPEEMIPIIFQEPKWFRLPAENVVETPLILIGPGTGVTPFIGFLQHLRALNLKHTSTSQTDRWLFFGCKNHSLDFIYRDEMTQFGADGTLTKLFLCESRPTKSAAESAKSAHHKYVQDAMRSVGQELVSFILRDTPTESRIYVCGDAKKMSKDVFQTFVDLIVKYEGKTSKEAVELLMDKKKRHCYNEDVWS